MVRTSTLAMVGALCATVTASLALLIATPQAHAHCDTMSGPIIPEASAALERGDITPVLKWIKPEHETELTAAFASTRRVRSQGPEAKALADRYFLETLIRLHREGEGAPYTGLKDAPPEKIVILADQALANGSAEPLIHALQEHLAAAVSASFGDALKAGESKNKSVAAGREFVEAYVHYMHFVEGIHAAITSTGAHGGEPPLHGHE